MGQQRLSQAEAEIHLNRAHDYANNTVTQQQAAINMMTEFQQAESVWRKNATDNVRP